MAKTLHRRFLGVVGMLVLGFALPAWAQGVLENPLDGAFKSGVGVLSGWRCNAGTITASFDGGPLFFVPYGSSREDTRSTCGHADTGFVLLVNWNLLGDGQHTVQIFDDGVPFANAAFSVTTLGTEFYNGPGLRITVTGWPQDGDEIVLVWQESSQNFVLQSFVGSRNGRPSAPSALMAIAVSASQINLSWRDNSSNELGFKVDRWNGEDWIEIATVGENVTTYQDAGLAPDTTYYYQVRAYNTAGSSAPTSWVEATTLDGTGKEINGLTIESEELFTSGGICAIRVRVRNTTEQSLLVANLHYDAFDSTGSIVAVAEVGGVSVPPNSTMTLEAFWVFFVLPYSCDRIDTFAFDPDRSLVAPG